MASLHFFQFSNGSGNLTHVTVCGGHFSHALLARFDFAPCGICCAGSAGALLLLNLELPLFLLGDFLLQRENLFLDWQTIQRTLFCR